MQVLENLAEWAETGTWWKPDAGGIWKPDPLTQTHKQEARNNGCLTEGERKTRPGEEEYEKAVLGQAGLRFIQLGAPFS